MFFAQADSFGKKLFDKDNLDFDLKSELNEFLYEHFVGSELTKYDSNGMSSYDDYTVSTFDDANYSLELDSVKKLNSKEYLVDISATLECEVDFFLDKYDALSTNDKSITIDLVANQIGFKSRSHFSRLFKRAYGLSPGKFQSEK